MQQYFNVIQDRGNFFRRAKGQSEALLNIDAFRDVVGYREFGPLFECRPLVKTSSSGFQDLLVTKKISTQFCNFILSHLSSLLIRDLVVVMQRSHDGFRMFSDKSDVK